MDDPREIPASSTARQAAAVAFVAEATRILGLFQGRESIVAAGIRAAIGWALKAGSSAGDPDWGEHQIDAFEQALTVVSRENDAVAWTLIQESLGDAYLTRAHGDSRENLERALECYEQALTFRKVDDDPANWAEMNHNLGNAYYGRLRGSLTENLERAIACYRAALTIRTSESDPNGWAVTRHNLGLAYADRIEGERAENLEHAIACYQDALTVFTRQKDERRWARALSNLALVYADRPSGDRDQNLKLAIACYQDALSVVKRENAAQEWAIITSNLATAWARSLDGDVPENLERAIACFDDALSVLNKEDHPAAWASTCTDFASLYLERLLGDRAENLERAIALLEKALTVRTAERDPPGWAEIQSNLGIAYSERLRGARQNNAETAARCFRSAAAIFESIGDWRRWATAYSNLGLVYSESRFGDASDNIEQAIACFGKALTVRKRDTDPRGWAQVRHNLGVAYLERVAGLAAENLERAIGCFKDALTIRTPESDARGCAETYNGLGNACAMRRTGDRAVDLETAVACLRKASELGEPFLQPAQLLQIYRSQALLLMRSGRQRWREADAVLRMAEASFRRSRGEALTSEARREMLAAMSEVGRWSALIAVAEGDPAGGLARLEAGRAVALRETLALDEILEESLDQTTKKVLVEIRRRIARLRAEAAMSGSDRSRPFHQVAAELRQEHEALAKALGRRADRTAGSLDTGEILRAIPAGHTLVVPLATEFGGLIFVISGGTSRIDATHVITCPALTSDAVSQQRAAWLGVYGAMMEGYAAAVPNLTSLWRSASTALEHVLDWAWQNVMGPAVARAAELELAAAGDQPRQAAELIIMPTGDLSILPLHAAWRVVEGTHRSVLDDFAVSYTPSLYSTRRGRLVAGPRSAGAAAGVLALINPTGDLPYSESLEIPALERSFSTPGERTILTRGDATKGQLKGSAHERAYLHLSCHGRFSKLDPLSSGLVLAGQEQLTLPEIAGELELPHCRWVMLSACEAGMIDVEMTPEEAVGLPAAFLQAGASCVIATLWSVADESTARFVDQVYRAHCAEGLPPAQAVRRASLWLRDAELASLMPMDAEDIARSKGNPSRLRFPGLHADGASGRSGGSDRPFRSPLFWAPFTCWGS